MSQLLPRYHRRALALEDQRKVDKLTRHAVDTTPATVARVTLPGDSRRLRGIPVAGGACGTSPGTDPWQELARRQRPTP